MIIELKGNTAAEILNKWISKSLNNTFYIAKLLIAFSRPPTIYGCVKDKLPLCATSMCIYKFICFCGAGYIDSTKRSLTKCTSEHHPVWFLKERKTITSSIQQHLIDSGHVAPKESYFKIIYTINELGRGEVESKTYVLLKRRRSTDSSPNSACTSFLSLISFRSMFQFSLTSVLYIGFLVQNEKCDQITSHWL